VLGLLADAAADAAGVLDRDVTAVVGRIPPSEQVAVERLGPLDVGRRQLVPAQRVDVVHERGADTRPRLPERHDRPGRISYRGYGPGVEHVERFAEDRGAPQLTGSCGGGVGVLDRDVGGPVRRCARDTRLRLLHAQDRDVVAALAQHRVSPGRSSVDVFGLPAEQTRVEALRALGIRGS